MPHELSQTMKCKEQMLREEYGNFDGGHYGSGLERPSRISRVTKRVPRHRYVPGAIEPYLPIALYLK